MDSLRYVPVPVGNVGSPGGLAVQLSLAQAHTALIEDKARHELGWSADIDRAQAEILAAGEDRSVIERTLNTWLSRFQPCVFGKLAATKQEIAYCVLTPESMNRSDVEIRDEIQSHRLQWLREARIGRMSAFIVIATSPALANAEPNDALLAFCARLASLYLLTEIAVDTVYFERAFLDIPGNPPSELEWRAGVNIFAAAGDKRWWHDHRIPGGVAFSVNSVGHLVKSGALGLALQELGKTLGIAVGGAATSKLDALPQALELAMQTINSASRVGGRPATRLCPRPHDLPDPLYNGCPFSIRPALANYDYRSYSGDYHTDYTLPRIYFRPEANRPAALPEYNLDFTYLFDADVNNFDYQTMGEGRAIRAGDGSTDNIRPGQSPRSVRTRPQVVSPKAVDDYLAELAQSAT
jgi:hypothetical protein